MKFLAITFKLDERETVSIKFEFCQGQGPISQTIFPTTFKCHGNFILTLIGILTKWSLQNCVHDTTTVLSWASGMCKNLLRSDDQQWNYSKVKFPLNLNCEQKLLLKRAPDPGRVQCEVMYLNYRPISDVASRLMNATAVTTDAYSSSPSRLTCRMIGML